MESPPQGSWWSIVDTVFGVLVGIGTIIAGSFRWLGKRFYDMEKRMDDLEKESIARNQLASISIARLEAYHASNQQRLDTIDDKLDRLIDGMLRRER